MDTIPPSLTNPPARPTPPITARTPGQRGWRCQTDNDHVIGYTVRQHGATVLVIYPPGGAQIPLAVITGHAVLTCPVCGCQRNWYPGEESLRDLLERMDRKIDKILSEPT